MTIADTRLPRRMRRLAAAVSVAALAAGAPALAQDDDTLVIALPTFSEQTMVPWAGSGQRKTYLDLVYEYLVYLDDDGTAVPGLAESWEMADDGTTWTFTLRQGVQFSQDAGEMTSEDVKYSIERLIDEDSRAGPASTMRRVIESIETPDDYTVVVNLSAPDFLLPEGYFGEAQQLGIVSKSYVEGLGEDEATALPAGTGPYVVESSTEGSEIVLTLRDDAADHWRVQPEWDRIVMQAVPEEATRVAMLRAGEADIAPVSFDSIPGLEGADIRIVSAEETWSPVIRLGGMVQTDEARYNPDNPWADVRVRQAMNYAVDKQTIIDELFQGQGSVAASDTPVRQWDGVEPYAYDPEQAKALLAEAGYEDGFSFDMVTSTIPARVQTAEAIQSQLGEVGITMNISQVPGAQIADVFYAQEQNDAMWASWGGRPDPSQTLALLYGADGFANPGDATTPEMEEAIAATLAVQSESEREDALHEAVRIAQDEALDVVLFYESIAFIYDADSVGGLEQWFSAKPEFRGVTAAG